LSKLKTIVLKSMEVSGLSVWQPINAIVSMIRIRLILITANGLCMGRC
jgi:hypothetical protein